MTQNVEERLLIQGLLVNINDELPEAFGLDEVLSLLQIQYILWGHSACRKRSRKKPVPTLRMMSYPLE